MIVDRLSEAEQYYCVHSRLEEGFRFLGRGDLAQLSDGRYEIDGDAVFAIVSRDEGRGREKSLLESHRRYLDIQFVVSGEDTIGWLPLAACGRISQAYNSETDLQFFFDRPGTWIDLSPGSFAIFFPQDAHAPLATSGSIHKVIVKVAL